MKGHPLGRDKSFTFTSMSELLELLSEFEELLGHGSAS